VERSSTQQAFIEAPVQAVWDLIGDPRRHPDWWPDWVATECPDPSEGCEYRGVIKGPFGRAEEHDLVLERLDDCHEISVSCVGTGVTTRFVITEARGGTFVEGHFGIEPNSLGMKALAVAAGRRVMRSWLERSLENLKAVAEPAATRRTG
jgi:uncharacterized protein YndB with AHSA1/START domain